MITCHKVLKFRIQQDLALAGFGSRMVNICLAVQRVKESKTFFANMGEGSEEKHHRCARNVDNIENDNCSTRYRSILIRAWCHGNQGRCYLDPQSNPHHLSDIETNSMLYFSFNFQLPRSTAAQESSLSGTSSRCQADPIERLHNLSPFTSGAIGSLWPSCIWEPFQFTFQVFF